MTLRNRSQPSRGNCPVTATDNAALDRVVFEVANLPGCTVSRSIASHPASDTELFDCKFPANGSYVVKARAFDFNNPTVPSNDATLNLVVPTN